MYRKIPLAAMAIIITLLHLPLLGMLPPRPLPQFRRRATNYDAWLAMHAHTQEQQRRLCPPVPIMVANTNTPIHQDSTTQCGNHARSCWKCCACSMQTCCKIPSIIAALCYANCCCPCACLCERILD